MKTKNIIKVVVFSLFTSLKIHAQQTAVPGYASISDVAQIAAGQQCPEWCWAASAEMLLSSQGINISQQVLVTRVFGTVTCQPAPSVFTIAGAMTGIYTEPDGSMVRITANANPFPPTDAFAMISTIKSGNPFIIGLNNQHAVVVYGIHWEDVYNYDFYYGWLYAYTFVDRLDFIDPYFTFGNPMFNSYQYNGYNLGGVTGMVTINSERLYPPQIIAAPVSEEINLGSPCDLSVTATGSSPMTFSWNLNGKVILKNQTGTFHVNKMPLALAGTYNISVSNPAGTATVPPTAITVNVPPPQIFVPPVSIVATGGSTAKFRVKAKGYGKLNYQWYFDGSPITNAVKSSLVLKNVGTNNVGAYYVSIQDAGGSTNSPPVTLDLQ